MTPRATVSEAVTSFVVVFGNSPHVRARADHFVANLSRDPRWSAEEVAEVRRLIDSRLGAMQFTAPSLAG